MHKLQQDKQDECLMNSNMFTWNQMLQIYKNIAQACLLQVT
jgi:hypothetical protein